MIDTLSKPIPERSPTVTSAGSNAGGMASQHETIPTQETALHIEIGLDN